MYTPGLVHPNVKDQVMHNQIKQEQNHDTLRKQRRFTVGDTVCQGFHQWEGRLATRHNN